MTTQYDRLVFNPPIPATLMGRGSVNITEASATAFFLKASPSNRLHAEDVSIVVSLAADERFELDVTLAPLDSDASQGREVWSAVPLAADKEAFHRLLARLRKGQHIALCRDEDVESEDRFTGFSVFSLMPKSLPDLDWDEISTQQTFLKHSFKAPILITGMTGGLKQGAEINLHLARAAAEFGIPMGVGSQRVALDHPEFGAIFEIKKSVPNVFLIGNIGIAQLSGSTSGKAEDICRRAIDMIQADALAIHLNVLQEVLQVEGDRKFRGLEQTIGHLANRLPVPVIVKEVGTGIDPDTGKRLLDAGVAAIDVGGKGGTSWGYIESLRSSSPVIKEVGRAFRDFGIPTAHAVVALRDAAPNSEIIATGGIRTGLDVAKALALGARMTGIGLPLFRAALESEQAVHDCLAALIEGLKTAMMCSGAATPDQLVGRVTIGVPGESLVWRRFERRLGI